MTTFLYIVGIYLVIGIIRLIQKLSSTPENTPEAIREKKYISFILLWPVSFMDINPDPVNKRRNAIVQDLVDKNIEQFRNRFTVEEKVTIIAAIYMVATKGGNISANTEELETIENTSILLDEPFEREFLDGIIKQEKSLPILIVTLDKMSGLNKEYLFHTLDSAFMHGNTDPNKKVIVSSLLTSIGIHENMREHLRRQTMEQAKKHGL